MQYNIQFLLLKPHYLHGRPELPREHVSRPGVELLGGLATLRRVRRLGQLVERLVQVPRALEACLWLRGHGFVLQYEPDKKNHFVHEIST